MSEIAEGSSPLASAVKRDFLASIVVFLVALPLCMGVAIASGAPVASGLITGIVGGMVVGFLSGCPLQVSGPAAGLTVIVYSIVVRFGLEQLSLIVFFAGLLQIAAGVFGLGQWFRAVSPAVIRGMLAGIGFLILGSQLHVMLDGKPPGAGATNLARVPAALQRAFAPATPSSEAPSEERVKVLKAARQINASQATLLDELSRLEPDSEASRAATPAVWKGLAAAQDGSIADLRLLESQVTDPELKTACVDAIGDLEATVVAFDRADQAAAVAAVKATSSRVGQMLDRARDSRMAGMLGLATILLIIGWTEFAPAKLKMIPPALVAVVIVSATAVIWQFPVYQVVIPDNLWSSISLPTTELLRNADWSMVLGQAALVAVVASAESLLCAAAVDQLHSGPRTRYSRELVAQGMGNVICGFLQALPMTGVIVRSSANVQAGGKTRLSTILHGVWLLVLVSGMTGLLRQIPTSCLAAILVYTGYKLIDIKAIRDLFGYGWGEVAIYATTVCLIVFEDLLTGVVVGIGLSALKLAYTFSHLKIELREATGSNAVTLALNGAATFLKVPALAAALEGVSPSAEVHVDFKDLDYIDHACLDLLGTWGEQHRAQGGKIVIDWESLHARFRRDRFRLAQEAIEA